jgi:hypothetical protein
MTKKITLLLCLGVATLTAAAEEQGAREQSSSISSELVELSDKNDAKQSHLNLEETPSFKEGVLQYFSFDAGIGVGYRHDQYKTVFFDPFNPDDPGLDIPVLKDKGKNIQSVAAEAFLKMFIMKYIFLRFEADYAWPQSGKIQEAPAIIFGPDASLDFPASTKIRGGKLYDILGGGGLAFNLLPSSVHQKLLLIPQGGYSLHYQKITKKSTAPTTEVFAPFGLVITLDQHLSKSALRTSWKGPFVGGDISTDPNRCFYLEVGYLFHFLTLDYKTNFVDSTTVPGFGDIVFQSLWKGSIKKAYAQQARGRIAYCFADNWKIALSGNYYFLSSKKDRSIPFKGVTDQAGDIILFSRPMKMTHKEQFYSMFLDLVYHY